MLMRIQDCYSVSWLQLGRRKPGAPAISVKGDWYRCTCLVPNDKSQAKELFDINNFSQEAPVLSRCVAEPIRSVVECQVDIVTFWKAGKCREYVFVSEVCVLPTLREFLLPPETVRDFLSSRLLWNVAHRCTSSGRRAELLELVVTGTVAYMLPSVKG
jgi:hypothetical protein